MCQEFLDENVKMEHVNNDIKYIINELSTQRKKIKL